MIEIENVANESCSPNLIFIKENHFQEDWVDFRCWKLTLKTENAQFLPACQYFCLQNIKISFDQTDFYTKISLILDPSARNSTTQLILLVSLDCVRW